MVARNASPSSWVFKDLPPLDEDRLASLAGSGSWSRGASSREERIFFDTPDWRLHSSGLVAEQRSSGEDRCFLVRTSGAAKPLARQPGEAPRRPLDAPQLPCNARLLPLVEMRALLPRVTVVLERTSWELRNEDEKIVLRLHQEELSCHAPEQAPPWPTRQVTRLEPLKGYPAPCSAVKQALIALTGQQPEQDEVFRLALQAIGTLPQPPAKKPSVLLEPQQPALAALRMILREQFEALLANEAGTRADLDSECLHDFRVAVRRTRSALGQLKALFPPATLAHFRSEFAWLGQITGPTRDLDVYLLDFPGYRAALPPEHQDDLAPLHDYLQRHQRREQRLLARRLNGRRYRRLVRDWRAWLEETDPGQQTGAASEAPVISVANRRIRKAFKRVVREGEAITPAAPDEDLHELRKSCKKLRYLLEFFASLYPTKAHRRLVKALKVLQENLGTFQDLSVQTAALREFSLRMSEEDQAPPATLLAMGMLIEQLLLRQQEVRREFQDRFAAFASAQTRRCFDEQFASGKPGKNA